ncbi:hypothetical protein DRO57_08850 [Candidatus Bathyarchaeota archaeon]|nr:MAG: hypothetical protein DRO57_08850 [Candidatus Bathyarchaeota archaeon]
MASLLEPNSSTIVQCFALDEALKFAEKDMEVHVFTKKIRGERKWSQMWFHGIETSTPLEYLRTAKKLMENLPVHGFFRAPNHIVSDVLYVQSILECIRELKPDILYAHFAYPEGFAAATVSVIANIPLVIAVHGYDVYTEPDLGYGIRRYKGYDVAVRWALDKANAVVAPSLHLYRVVSENILKSSLKLYLVSNGVDVKRFHPEVSGSRVKRRWRLEGKKVVFALKGHTRWCGFGYLIAAAAHVCGVRKDVVFIIGGDGELRPFYEALAAKLGIRRRIIFPGWISRVEVPSYYAACDVFVAPSLVEGFGLTVTEAMAMGKPVVASDVGGLREQITDRVNGFLVPPKSVRVLADRILYLLDNPDEARRMGLRGRKIVEKMFNLDDRVERLLQIFRRLAKSS